MDGAEIGKTMVAQELIAPTVRGQLVERKRRMERDLQSVNEAIAMLDENPGFEKVHDAINKANLFIR